MMVGATAPAATIPGCSAALLDTSKLRRRKPRIPPFQKKREADSDENEGPYQNAVYVSLGHIGQQEQQSRDQE